MLKLKYRMKPVPSTYKPNPRYMKNFVNFAFRYMQNNVPNVLINSDIKIRLLNLKKKKINHVFLDFSVFQWYCKVIIVSRCVP